jgi:hypothetical protein
LTKAHNQKQHNYTNIRISQPSSLGDITAYGQGLAKLMAGSSLGMVERATMENPQPIGQVYAILSSLEQHDWYFSIVYYLKNLSCLVDLDKSQKQSLKLRATKYCLMQGGLG